MRLWCGGIGRSFGAVALALLVGAAVLGAGFEVAALEREVEACRAAP